MSPGTGAGLRAAPSGPAVRSALKSKTKRCPMEGMAAVMADNPAAACAGLFAMVCLTVWPLFRTRPMMLSVYVGNNLGFVVHYALLGHWTAVAMNAILAVQTVAAIGLVRYPRLRVVYFAMIPLLGAAALA